MKTLLLVPIAVVIDQISKLWIKSTLPLNGMPREVLGDLLRFRFVENSGAAFGISVGSYLPVITISSIFVSFFIAYYYYLERNSHIFIRSGLALILGGAIGNIIDRLFVIFKPELYHGVIDFIDIGIGTYRWFTFNVADMAVTIGITLYILNSIINPINKTE